MFRLFELEFLDSRYGEKGAAGVQAAAVQRDRRQQDVLLHWDVEQPRVGAPGGSFVVHSGEHSSSQSIR